MESWAQRQSATLSAGVACAREAHCGRGIGGLPVGVGDDRRDCAEPWQHQVPQLRKWIRQAEVDARDPTVH